ncbi:MAG: hypothetical protein KME64_12110 [Scytonematopsis contorta HA4267-MV1]|nr:hypothetical protein [Scytonematopsis contorta HA4267-MV1]
MISKLPITNPPPAIQLTVNSQQLTTNSQQSTVNNQQSTILKKTRVNLPGAWYNNRETCGHFLSDEPGNDQY